MDAKTRRRIERLEARQRALAARLAETGFLTRGSVVAATTTCGQPTCRCHTDPEARHGPYWQWTRAVGGKTHTRRLSPTGAERFQRWVDNRREAESILREMEELTLEVADLLDDAERGDRTRRRDRARTERPG